MERPAILNKTNMGRPREEPVFDEHEEWPEMLAGCEARKTTLDNDGELANRFASLRTVERKP